MNKMTLVITAMGLSYGSLAIAADDMSTKPIAKKPEAHMGPTSGSGASQTTPSLKQEGKDAFTSLDKDGNGDLTEEEAAKDPSLAKLFGESDENKNGKIDAAEFARSNATGSPANATPVKK